MTDATGDDTGPGIDRRALLSVVGVGAAGLAGCLGGGGGGNGGDGGPLQPLEAPDSPPEEDPSKCHALMNGGFDRYDESGSPFVATFEYPTGGSGVVATATMNSEHSLTVRGSVDGQPFDMFPSMVTDGTEQQTAAQKGELSGLEAIATIEYAGETLPVVRAAAGKNGDEGATRYTKYPYYVVGVPYEGSSGKRYYRYDFRATVEFADGLETGACEATWEAVAKRMIASLEPNADTTVESE